MKVTTESGRDGCALEAVEIRKNQGSDQLTDPIGTEVEADQAVTGLQTVRCQAGGFDEFIGDLGSVGLLKHLKRVQRGDRFRLGEQPEGPFGAIPAAVSVHGPVAPADRGDRADAGRADLVLDRPEETGSTGGWGVPTVGDDVEADLGKPTRCSPVQQPTEVVDVAVDTAIGTQTDQVEAST